MYLEYNGIIDKYLNSINLYNDDLNIDYNNNLLKIGVKLPKNILIKVINITITA